MEFIEHFHNLLGTTAQCNELDISTLQSGPCLIDAQQQELVRQVASEEIKDALMDIGNDLAQSRMGMGSSFSKHGTRWEWTYSMQCRNSLPQDVY